LAERHYSNVPQTLLHTSVRRVTMLLTVELKLSTELTERRREACCVGNDSLSLSRRLLQTFSTTLKIGGLLLGETCRSPSETNATSWHPLVTACRDRTSPLPSPAVWSSIILRCRTFRTRGHTLLLPSRATQMGTGRRRSPVRRLGRSQKTAAVPSTRVSLNVEQNLGVEPVSVSFQRDVDGTRPAHLFHHEAHNHHCFQQGFCV